MSNQFLKLRRSAVQGKIPETSSLDLGELAINTYDGQLFLKKSGSQGEIVTVVGSTGSFTGSFFGNGAGLTSIPASGITGLNLSRIATGSVSASVDVADTAFNIVSASVQLLHISSSGGVSIGSETIATGIYSHAEGYSTLASGSYSHAEGNGSAYGIYSHAEGNSTEAIGESSHAEGYSTEAIGEASHAEGYGTMASGSYSHAEGTDTQAIGESSHAEGYQTQATGDYSHTEGYVTIAIGYASHAEGDSTEATGEGSHAEGGSTLASGFYSHAEGKDTQAIGEGSHAEGIYTVALGDYQHVQGQYNISSSAQSAFIIGNGTSDASRSNLVFASGSSFQISGSLQVTGSSVSLTGGSFSGSGANLYNIPASGITGLNLSQIATGSVSASVSATDISASFRVTSGSNTLLNVTRDGFIWIGNGSFVDEGYQADIQGSTRVAGSITVGSTVASQFISTNAYSIFYLGANISDGYLFMTSRSGSIAIGSGDGVTGGPAEQLTNIYYANSGNVFIGHAAVGSGNNYNSVIIGYKAGKFADINNIGNVILGSEALGAAASGDVNYNVAIGSQASYRMGVGGSPQRSVAVGYQANYSGSGYGVMIGYQAGFSELNPQKLYIANSNTTSPLIGGDFFSGSVGINMRISDISASLHVKGTGATSASNALVVDNSNLVDLLRISNNGQQFVTSPVMTLTSSNAGYLVSQSLVHSGSIPFTRLVGVNITPSFTNTTSSQTQTALRVSALFTGSASGSNTNNVIVDFGTQTSGSMFVIDDSAVYLRADTVMDEGFNFTNRVAQGNGTTLNDSTASLYTFTFATNTGSAHVNAIVTGYDSASRATVSGEIKSTIKCLAGVASIIGTNFRYINAENPGVNIDLTVTSNTFSVKAYGTGSRTYVWGATVTTQVI